MANNEIILIQDPEKFLSDVIDGVSKLIKESGNHEEKRWLHSSEICRLLGISKSSLQTLRNKQLIPYSKLNGIYYYDQNEIDRLLNQGMKGGDR